MFLKTTLKKAIFALTYFVFALSIELITFSMLKLGMPKYFLFDISILFFLTAILFVIPGAKGQIVFSGIFLFLQSAISFINSILSKIDGSLFSIEMLKVGGEGLAAFDSSFINVKFLLIILGVFLLALFVLILINKLLKTKVNYKAGFILMLVSICVITQFLSFGLFKLQLSELYPSAENKGNVFLDDALLYDTLEIKREALKKFGSFGFYYKDLQNALSVNQLNSEDVGKLRDYLHDSQDSRSTESLYHGVSENNNLIMIMCESLEWYAISDSLTPNLYELANRNISNDKFYSNNKTNVSEGLGILGSYPKKAAFSKDFATAGLHEEETAFAVPFSLPNILKREGYKSKYFHDYDGDFYGRSSTHKDIFGFDDFIDMYGINDPEKFTNPVSDISKDFGDWMLDSEMFGACINEIAPNDGSNFFSFVTTVTMHGPYDGNPRLQDSADSIDIDSIPNIDSSEFTDKQKERMVNYIAAAMDLDKAIDILMDHLTSTGLIDNTTVILYADHWAYYQELNYLAKNLPTTELYNPELYRIPFIMVDKKLQKAINGSAQGYNINSYMSAHDLVPTILDLFGFTYNTKLFLGKSVFLENIPYSCLNSHLSGFFNDKLFTYNGEDFLYGDEMVNKKEKENFKKYLIDIVNKQNYIDLIYLLKDTNIKFSFDGIFIAEKSGEVLPV